MPELFRTPSSSFSSFRLSKLPGFLFHMSRFVAKVTNNILLGLALTANTLRSSSTLALSFIFCSLRNYLSTTLSRLATDSEFASRAVTNPTLALSFIFCSLRNYLSTTLSRLGTDSEFASRAVTNPTLALSFIFCSLRNYLSTTLSRLGTDSEFASRAVTNLLKESGRLVNTCRILSWSNKVSNLSHPYYMCLHQFTFLLQTQCIQFSPEFQSVGPRLLLETILAGGGGGGLLSFLPILQTTH